MERRVVIIAVHDHLEDPVDGVANGPAAPEVVVQIDADGILVPPAAVFLVPVAKDLRLRQPELIDALLDIAHHEQIVLPGDAADDLLLEHVAVLILVDENILEPLPVVRGGVLVLQDLDGVVHAVIEIHQVLIALAPAVHLLRFLDQPDEIRRVIRKIPQDLAGLLQTLGKILLFQIVDAFFSPVPKPGHILFDRIVSVLLRARRPHRIRLESLQRLRKRLQHVFPAALRQIVFPAVPGQLPDLFYFLHILAGLQVYPFRLFFMQNLGCRVKPMYGVPQHVVTFLDQEPVDPECPDRILAPHSLCLLFRPVHIPRDAADLFVDVQHLILQPLVAAVPAVLSQKGLERIGILLKTPLEHLIHRVALHDLQSGLIPDDESRLQVGQIKEIPHDPQRKSMERADTRRGQKLQLLLQEGVPLLLLSGPAGLC